MSPRSRKPSLTRKQQAGRFNRKLGWISLPLLIATSGIYYIHGDDAHLVSGIVQVLFLPLFFAHVVLSLYVFGVVAPRPTLRVFHIYLGYATFVVVMVSQTTFGMEPLHTILTILMYALIAGHIAIAVKYGVARRAAEVPSPKFTRAPDATA